MRAGAEREEQRVSDGEAHRDAERARALHRRRFRAGAHRQRRDRHQVIGAESVQESERESGGEKDQEVTAAFSRREVFQSAARRPGDRHADRCVADRVVAGLVFEHTFDRQRCISRCRPLDDAPARRHGDVLHESKRPAVNEMGFAELLDFEFLSLRKLDRLCDCRLAGRRASARSE